MNILLTAAQTVADHAHYWAAPEPTPTSTPTGEVNTSGILGFLAKYIVPILFGVLGVITITRAAKGNVSQTMTTSMIAIIGVGFVAGAGVFFFAGDNIVHLLFK